MEANVKQEKWFIPCCENEECHLCKGTSKIYPERCPSYYYRELETLRYLYENYRFKNILPYDGSPLNQPYVIIHTFDLIDHYLSVFNSIKTKEKEKNRQVAEELRSRLSRD